jgi:hypothetical protein
MSWTGLSSQTPGRRLGDCGRARIAAHCDNSSHGTKTIGAAAFALVLAALVFLGCGSLEPASAQAPGILANGNAVVTGFSGAPLPAQLPPGLLPADLTFIDLNGPSARVVDLQAPGAPPRAQLIAAPIRFTASASQVGQVFAVALDDATPPNIYVAATSSYGLPIVVTGQDGAPVRVYQGTPGARFMAGLFGPAAQGGGPGSIWRIDGATGAVSLFANVTLGGVANSGPGLGGLAFDGAANSMIVADRDTGMIHRFALTGAEVGRYDHGVQGRTAAGLPPVAFDPAKRLDITSPNFNTQDPSTWSYAPPERRVFGLAVRGGRLYYAVAAGLQVWSVSLAADGSFGSDARVEISALPGNASNEVSKITFDDQGRMLLAERAGPTGADDFVVLAPQSAGLLLRYRFPPPNPGLDEYAIGFFDVLRNSTGGTAVGYGYDAAGRLDPSSCGGFLWTTGHQLRSAADPTLAAQLSATGPLNINGLQGNAIDLVRPANVPPLLSYFVELDDSSATDAARGHVADIAIPRRCGQASVVPQPVPPVLFCPVGEIYLPILGPYCQFPLVPAPDGTCVPPPYIYSACPSPLVPGPYGSCMEPPPYACPPPLVPGPDGTCVPPILGAPLGICACPDGLLPGLDGTCLPLPPFCPAGQFYLPITPPYCQFPFGLAPDGTCLPPAIVTCQPPLVPGPYGTCVQQPPYSFCPPPLVVGPDGTCVPPSPDYPPGVCVCPDGQLPGFDGFCLPPPPPVCQPPLVPGPNNTCVCPNGGVLNDGVCGPPLVCQPPLVPGPFNNCVCPNGGVLNDGACVPPLVCRSPLVRGPNNTCVCPNGGVLSDGVCLPPLVCRSPLVPGPNNTCVCPNGGRLINGVCVSTPVRCLLPLVPGPDNSCVCQNGGTLRDGVCVPPGGTTVVCRLPLVPGPNNTCECPNGGTLRDGRCVPPSSACPQGEQRNAAGVCVKSTTPAPCRAGQERNAEGVCVKTTTPAPCRAGQERNAEGVCVKSTTTVPCPEGEVRTSRGCVKTSAKPTPNPKEPSQKVIVKQPPPKVNVIPPKVNLQPKVNLPPKPVVQQPSRRLQ